MDCAIYIHIAYYPQVCQHAITGRNPIPGTVLDQFLTTVIRTDTDIPGTALDQFLTTVTADQDFNAIPEDITATVTAIHTDVPDYIIETIDITTGVLHDALTPVNIIPTMTPHIADCHHTGAHQLILSIRADHILIQCTNQVSKLCINLQCVLADLKTSCIIKEIQES